MLLGEQDHLMKNCFKYTLIQKGEFIKLFANMDSSEVPVFYLLQPIWPYETLTLKFSYTCNKWKIKGDIVSAKNSQARPPIDDHFHFTMANN